MKERLLKRLRRWSTEQQQAISDLIGTELAESVREDLELLLNTRRGTVLIDNEMGLPDLTRFVNGYSAPEVEELQHDILLQVKNFEPRLSGVDIRYVGDQGSVTQLAFNLSAQLQGKQPMPFSVRIAMKENGSTSVTL